MKNKVTIKALLREVEGEIESFNLNVDSGTEQAKEHANKCVENIIELVESIKTLRK